MAFNIIIYW